MDYEVEIKIIASKIKSLRLAQHMSIQELANKCDIERPNMSRIESGTENVTIKTLCKICTALNITLSDIIR